MKYTDQQKAGLKSVIGEMSKSYDYCEENNWTALANNFAKCANSMLANVAKNDEELSHRLFDIYNG